MTRSLSGREFGIWTLGACGAVIAAERAVSGGGMYVSPEWIAHSEMEWTEFARLARVVFGGVDVNLAEASAQGVDLTRTSSN